MLQMLLSALAATVLAASAPPAPAARLTIRDVMTPAAEAACGIARLTAAERAAFEAWLNRDSGRAKPFTLPQKHVMRVFRYGQGAEDWYDRTPPRADTSFRDRMPPRGDTSFRFRTPPRDDRPRAEPRPDSGSSIFYHDEVPLLVKRVDPPSVGIAGKVVVNVLVGEDGTVRKAEFVQGDPRLQAAAEAAVKQWLFKPSTANGKPVATWVAVPLTFK